MKKLVFSLVLLPVLLACNATRPLAEPSTAQPAPAQPMAATWKGELPCADCAGQAYQLTLSPDGTYSERSEYVGKAGDEVRSQGQWAMGADSVIMLQGNTLGSSKHFVLQGSALRLLDQNGKAIGAAFPERYVLTRVAADDNPAVGRDLAERGVDFVAVGTEPGWALEMDFEGTMRFTGPQGLTIVAATGQGVRAADASVVCYQGEAAPGRVQVSLYRQKCLSGAAGGKTTGWTVRVDLQKAGFSAAEHQQLSGCGSYLGDYRLNDRWVLQKMGGQALLAAPPAGPPTLELRLAEGQALGFGGCNRFAGGVQRGRSSLTFQNLAATRMAGPGLKLESQYLRLLSGKKLLFQLQNDRLYLGEGENTLVFRRAD